MFKLLVICTVFAATLSACEQQKQASAKVGAIPKKIVDKATSDINAAEALAAKQTEALKDIETPAESER
jgi:hypothetical protein